MEQQYVTRLAEAYKQGYEIRYVNATEFKFEAVDLTDTQ